MTRMNILAVLDIVQVLVGAVKQAQEEGRDVSSEELTALRTAVADHLDRQQARIDAMPGTAGT